MTTKPKKRVAIIGGGAAGFFAAISAAHHHPDAEVSIYEATNKLLAKVLISGGGRCNVTNDTLEISELIKNYPRGNKELRGAFSRFAVKDTIKWFAERGVTLKTEPDRRMFPVTDNSQTIAQCLINSAKDLNVQISIKHKVSKILRSSLRGRDTFKLLFAQDQNTNQHTEYDKIILTTGGSKSSLKLPESLGHTITELAPSLFSFEVKDSQLTELSGISFPQVSLTLLCSEGKKFKQDGPILITHWGFSGPAIIKLSAFAARELLNSNYSATLEINFFPEENWDSILQQLTLHKKQNPRLIVSSDSFLHIPKRYWLKIINEVSAKEKQTWNELSKKQLQALATQLTRATYQISGKGVFKEEFVTCGGVSLKEINFTTMESKITPGVFFAGEVLDIDGITGGFNFQAAWTAGWIAGKS